MRILDEVLSKVFFCQTFNYDYNDLVKIHSRLFNKYYLRGK